MLAEYTVVGAAALAMAARLAAAGRRVRHPSPRPVERRHRAVGARHPASHRLVGRIRNRFLNWTAKNVVLRAPQRQVASMIHRLSGAELDVFFMDWPIHADHYAQFTVPGFEYPRRDLPANVSFIGPVIRASRSVRGTARVVERPRSRPSGRSTSRRARSPTETSKSWCCRPFAPSRTTTCSWSVSTGGAPVRTLGPLPANARAAEFLPYGELMPNVRVFVTNGGYGGLHFALGHGVPIVVAGETEDKMETTRRVEWSGAGINLRTGTPTEAQIAAAVDRVLSERAFPRASARASGRDRVGARPAGPRARRHATSSASRRVLSGGG